MRRLGIFMLSIMIFALLCGCEVDDGREASKVKQNDCSQIDENSTDYNAGRENGIRSVVENPMQYGLYSEESAQEIIGHKVALECRDNVIEYLLDNGYEFLAREMCGDDAVDLYLGFEPNTDVRFD